ncbi:MAG: cytochrome c [Salibacteraceae bacterium]
MIKLAYLKPIGYALILGVFAFTACSPDPQSPGVEYMPDMYRTPALEPYAGNALFPDSMEALQPPKGTIPRGFMPYGIPNTNEGYEMAGALLTNPFPASETIIAEGKEIYTKYCIHCHGEKGMGDGPTVAAGHPPPPAYNSASLKNLPEGKMFHSITYGKNMMGSHSSQLSVDERWKVIRYVQTLQNPDAKKDESASPEATEADQVTTEETAMKN